MNLSELLHRRAIPANLGLPDYRYWTDLAVEEGRMARADVLSDAAYLEGAGRLARMLLQPDPAEVPSWRGLAEALAVPWQPEPWLGPEPVAAPVAKAPVLARIAGDVSPTAMEEAPLLLLGPWAWQVRMEDPCERSALVNAVAEVAHMIHPGQRRSPLRTWLRSPPRAAQHLRDQVQRLRQSPMAPYRVVEGPGGLHLQALLPLAARHLPEGPVDLSALGGVAGPARPGRDVWARVVLTPEGWTAAQGFVLPGELSAEWLEGTWRPVALQRLLLNRVVRAGEVLRDDGWWMVAMAHRAMFRA